MENDGEKLRSELERYRRDLPDEKSWPSAIGGLFDGISTAGKAFLAAQFVLAAIAWFAYGKEESLTTGEVVLGIALAFIAEATTGIMYFWIGSYEESTDERQTHPPESGGESSREGADGEADGDDRGGNAD